MPFLENVTRGRSVPPERLEEVAHHYARFDGVSPINEQNRALIAALRPELDRARDRPVDLSRQPQLAPVPRGHAARDAGRRGPACARLLHERLQLVLELPSVPREHPRRAGRGRAGRARGRADAHVLQPPGIRRGERGARRGCARAVPEDRRAGVHLAFTAHSIPLAMARQSRYESQLAEASRLVGGRGRRRRPGGRLPEPQRLAAGAVARAGRLRPHPGARRARRSRRRPLADRLRLRPRGGAVRPRRRGARGGGGGWRRPRPRADGRHAPGLRGDDPRARSRSGSTRRFRDARSAASARATTSASPAAASPGNTLSSPPARSLPGLANGGVDTDSVKLSETRSAGSRQPVPDTGVEGCARTAAAAAPARG